MDLTAEQGVPLNLPAVRGMLMSAPKLVAWRRQPARCWLSSPEAVFLCETFVCELQALSAEPVLLPCRPDTHGSFAALVFRINRHLKTEFLHTKALSKAASIRYIGCS